MKRFAGWLLAGVFSLLPAMGLVARGEGPDRFDELAARGQIEESAPVKAESKISIHASPEKVWQILTGIDDWPKWQTAVSAAHLDGALAPGTGFTWTNGGTEIRSRLALVESPRRIGWTGTAYKARAVHLWSLEALPDGGTLVTTRESMDGFMLRAFYSSEKLAKSHEVWLQALKRRAEQ